MLTIVLLVSILIAWSYAAIKSPPLNDLSLHHYTDEGEIAQIKYASEAVVRSMPILGWIEPSLDASVIVSCSRSNSPLCLSTIHASDVLEGSIVVASTGLRSDCRQLLQEANRIILSNRFTFGHPPNLEKLCHNLAVWLTKGLYPQSDEDEEEEDNPPTRPYATVALLSQYDTSDNKVRMFQLHNSGVFQECSFSCLGRLSDVAVREVKRVALSATLKQGTIADGQSTSEQNQASSESLFEKLNKVLKILTRDLSDGSEGQDGHAAVQKGDEDLGLRFEVYLLMRGRTHRAQLSGQQLLKSDSLFAPL